MTALSSMRQPLLRRRSRLQFQGEPPSVTLTETRTCSSSLGPENTWTSLRPSFASGTQAQIQSQDKFNSAQACRSSMYRREATGSSSSSRSATSCSTSRTDSHRTRSSPNSRLNQTKRSQAKSRFTRHLMSHPFASPSLTRRRRVRSTFSSSAASRSSS